MITTWLEIGLSNALVATVLAAVALVATRRLRPQWAFAVWLLVLVKLLVPPVWNAPLGTLRSWTPAPESTLPSDWLDGDSSLWMPPHDSTEFVAKDIATDAIAGEQAATPDVVSVAALEISGISVLFSVWCLGAAVWSGLALWRIRTFAVGLRQTRRAPAYLQGEVHALALALGVKRVPLVRLSRRRVPPLVWALGGRPTILLPAGLLRTLSAPQRTALLMHELVHLRRRDHIVKLVELAALALYWWLPAAWWARRKLEQAAEHCCDAEVVGRMPGASRAYAEALVATIDFLSGTSQPLPLGASGFSQFGHVSRRIEMILQPPSRRPRIHTWISCLVLLAVSLAVLPLSVCTLWAEPARTTHAGVPDEASVEPEAATPSAEPSTDEQSCAGGKFVDSESGKDWDANYGLTREQVDAELRKVVKKAVAPIETADSRREAASRQLAAMEKAFETNATTLDQLLEAQRRIAEAEAAFARQACALCPDAERRELLCAQANVLITTEAMDRARRTWQQVYSRQRDGVHGGEAREEAQAREQFHQFKSQLGRLVDEYDRAQAKWPYPSGQAAPRPATPGKSDASSKSTPAGASSESLVEAESKPAEVKMDQKEEPKLILGCSLEAPTDEDVLRAVNRAMYKDRRPAPGKSVRIVKEKTATYVDPPQSYPLIGKAQQHHVHYKCTVHFEDSTGKQTTEVVYIDRNQFHIAAAEWDEWNLGFQASQPPLRRELVLMRHRKLELAREESTLADLQQEFIHRFVRQSGSAVSAADDQARTELKAKISKAQWRVDQRKKELDAVRQHASKRISSHVGPSYNITQSIEYFIGSKR